MFLLCTEEQLVSLYTENAVRCGCQW